MVLWRKMKRDRAASSQRTNEARKIRCESIGSLANPPMVSIGPELEFRGELTGNSDLRIEGLVEGRINLNGHRLIIGTRSHVTAEVHAKHVIVRGEINGDVIAEEKIEILPTGTVRGTLTAQRIVLSDGSDFHGTVNKVSGKSADNVCAFAECAEAKPDEAADAKPQNGASKNKTASMWTLIETSRDH